MTTPPLTLGRDPGQPPRTRRWMELAGSLFNDLIRQGILFLISPGKWGMSNLLFVGHGPPADAVGYTGTFYLDLDSGVLFEKVL